MPENGQVPTTAPPQAEQTQEPATEAPDRAPEMVESDLLVEDVSIDGMCGVY